MEARSQVELPPVVHEPFDVFVNGVPQQRGRDYDVRDRTLVFTRELAGEGRLGFWRWVSLLLGVAGTYRKNDKVDVVYSVGAGRKVVTLSPAPAAPATPPPAR